MFNPKIFKAYDIRGIYDVDFDDAFAYDLGLAYVSWRQQELDRTNLKLVVGSDMRLSSPSLKENLIQGMRAGGAEVIDVGVVATPTFYFTVAHYNYDGGIVVSASHNPKEYNGFKLVREHALPIGETTGLNDLRDFILERPAMPAAVSGKIIQKNNVVYNQITCDLAYGNLDKIEPLKIVIDTANAMGAPMFDELFKHLNCEIIKLNWELDGSFPAHEADPFKSENIQELCKEIVKQKADLGIATDGDADRIFFVDETGAPIDPGITRAILAKIFLREKPGSKIAYDIRPGKITRDVIIENGGTPIVTRVGHSLIKEQTIREGAYFAGESSGHFFLNMSEGCYEVPMIVTLRILQELSEVNLKFSDYIKDYQKYYHSGEINLRVADTKAVIEKIKQACSDGQQNELDGITVEYPNYWFNVRASNTEPLIRLNLEAVDQKTMEAARDRILGMIK